MKKSRRVNVPAARRKAKKRGSKRSAKPSRNIAQAAAFKEMRRKVDEFAKTHKRFDELAKPIMFWIGKGLDIDDAYLVADTLCPSRRAMIENAMKRLNRREYHE